MKSILSPKTIIVVFILQILVANIGFTQSFWQSSDTLNRPRFITLTSLTAAGWSGSMLGLQFVWYKNYPKTKFHFFDDSKEWMQMDKLGHLYTSYTISEKMSRLYHWSGVSKNASNIIGSAIGLGYQSTLEILDGFNTEWGFSWSDMLANFFGTALYLGQEFGFHQQIFRPKFSFYPSKYAQYRPNTLGSNFAEQLLKDYNGQTYWLSFSPFSFWRNKNLPKWLCLSVGFSIEGKLAGYANTYTTAEGTIFNAQRELILSLDIDVSKFHFKKRWPKILLSPFNLIKIPFPAIIFTNGRTSGRWIYF